MSTATLPIGTGIEQVEAIRKGVSMTSATKLAEELGLSQKEMAPLVGISLRSFSRKKHERLSPRESEQVAGIKRVLISADEYFGDRTHAIAWLNQPHVAFNNQTPLMLLDTMTGIECVLNILNRMKYGFTA